VAGGVAFVLFFGAIYYGRTVVNKRKHRKSEGEGGEGQQEPSPQLQEDLEKYSDNIDPIPAIAIRRASDIYHDGIHDFQNEEGHIISLPNEVQCERIMEP
jgi:hypothetical protein